MKHSKMKLKTWAAALMLLPAVALAAPAQRGGEIVSFGTPPADFETGYQASQGGQTIVELVPKGQTVQNWDRMVTIQTFASDTRSVSDFGRAVSDGWRSACPGGNTINLSEGQENGYPFALWQMSCEHNPQSGRPEYTWIKAMRGERALYVAQYAFRHLPSRAELTDAALRLRGMSLCDTRPDRARQHPCGRR
ncbi:hypothetical protein A7P85_08010 [Eikenella corrodens]|uniref:Uncharacterized protein n=1 Tax=Eikenella corrodens TaxID=539 RepID=A0A1A9RCZ9_EIKCO|nr:hypothetical protein [Eikenella corrodens]OAM15971.1 hypothetical protein A7P85_08010 [Eikenella corrodens]